MTNKISLFKNSFDVSASADAVKKILESGWTSQGEKVDYFERAISDYICELGEDGFAVEPDIYTACVNSCTAALHLAVKLYNLSENTYVATTPLTFVSTNHVLMYERLVPVFVDIDYLTGNMDPNSLSEAIKKYDIKLIVVVHYSGYPADMAAINEMAREHKIPVIEDCAHAMGARYSDGLMVGNSWNKCCFSFHAVKNLGLGDGGAVTTNSRETWEWFKKMRWMGIDKSTKDRQGTAGSYLTDYDVCYTGYKYNMSDIIASIGLVELSNLNDRNGKRESISNAYRNSIVDSRVVHASMSKEKLKPSYHFHWILVSDEKLREKIVEHLRLNNIQTGRHYKLNSDYPIYQQFPKMNDLKSAKAFSRNEITLPTHCEMNDGDVYFVIDKINEVLK